jgi:hypothetical protein
MTNDQLIMRARDYASNWWKLSSKPMTLDDFPQVRAREAVVLYFESDKPEAGHVEVCLDKETGELIEGGYKPNFDA